MKIKNLTCKVIKTLIYKDSLQFLHRTVARLVGRYNYYRFLSWAETGCLKDVQLGMSEDNNLVCLMFDGRTEQAGLADNLRAATSIYEMCKVTGQQFKIVFNYPFILENYLLPNRYDWLYVPSANVYTKNSIDIVSVSYNSIFGSENTNLQKRYLQKAIQSNKSCRIYSNAYCYDECFHDNFHELFKPSMYLQKQIDDQLAKIGGSFVSASFRFANLLGDLKDTFGKELLEYEKSRLIKKCADSLEEIHKNNPTEKLLLTSDSISFINYVEEHLDYVYVIPGNIGHVGHDGGDAIVTKTFLDLFLISYARTVYMVRSSEMYKSGFAHRASMIGNKPFVEIIL